MYFLCILLHVTPSKQKRRPARAEQPRELRPWTWRSLASRVLLDTVVMAAATGIVTWLMKLPPRLIAQTAVSIRLTTLCFLPPIGLLVWAYETSVLERLGKTSLWWRIAGIPIAGFFVTGVVLAAALPAGNAPGRFFWLSDPSVKLQASTYCSNGWSPILRDGKTLDVRFGRFLLSQFLADSSSPLLEVPFEVGVILGTQPPAAISLEGKKALHIKLEVKENTAESLPHFGIGIKDALRREVKCSFGDSLVVQERGLTLIEGTIPLDVFSKLSLNNVVEFVLFSHDLVPGQEIRIELKELKVE
jgi:hypothetical protein